MESGACSAGEKIFLDLGLVPMTSDDLGSVRKPGRAEAWESL